MQKEDEKNEHEFINGFLKGNLDDLKENVGKNDDSNFQKKEFENPETLYDPLLDEKNENWAKKKLSIKI